MTHRSHAPPRPAITASLRASALTHHPGRYSARAWPLATSSQNMKVPHLHVQALLREHLARARRARLQRAHVGQKPLCFWGEVRYHDRAPVTVTASFGTWIAVQKGACTQARVRVLAARPVQKTAKHTHAAAELALPAVADSAIPLGQAA